MMRPGCQAKRLMHLTGSICNQGVPECKPTGFFELGGDAVPSRVYTIETRIPGSSKVVDYLNTYVTEYSALTRRMWHDMTSPDFKERFPAMSRYVTYICRKYGLLKRTVNSIRFDVQGRMKSLMELKKTELLQTDIKINSCGDRIKSIKSQLDMLKQKAAANSLGDRELEKYQNLKQSLYWQKNRLNRLKQRKAGLEYQIREKVYDMCYGSKEMFRRQHRLMENGYKTHEKWHNDFIRSRDRNIFYLGSSDESFGNQMCRLKYNSQTGFFTLELRKEYKYCTDKKACSKYIRLGGLDFKYMKDNLAEILESYDTAGNGRWPLSYRFHKTGNRWYLQAIFEQSFTDYRTVSKYGAVGLDYNDGFIELSETDSSGNLTGLKHFTLKNHGTGKKAEAEIRDVIAEITGYAEKRCKDIVIEDLDFKRKKACGTARSGKKSRKYNRMLHLFDYHRYKQTLQNTGFNHRVNIVIVNPKNTSKIGKQKYCGSRKLNIHQAAAYVIARRGQGYNDKLTA